jgi:hypothetical protein
MNRQEILARIETSWQDFLHVIDGIPSDRATEPGVSGEWSTRDILGHLAFWEDRAAAALEGIGEGSGDNANVDELNAAEYDRISRMSYDEAYASLMRSHERIVSAASAADALTPGDVEGDTWEHYEEHGADISRWRAREGI